MSCQDPARCISLEGVPGVLVREPTDLASSSLPASPLTALGTERSLFPRHLTGVAAGDSVVMLCIEIGRDLKADTAVCHCRLCLRLSARVCGATQSCKVVNLAQPLT